MNRRLSSNVASFGTGPFGLGVQRRTRIICVMRRSAVRFREWALSFCSFSLYLDQYSATANQWERSKFKTRLVIFTKVVRVPLFYLILLEPFSMSWTLILCLLRFADKRHSKTSFLPQYSSDNTVICPLPDCGLCYPSAHGVSNQEVSIFQRANRAFLYYVEGTSPLLRFAFST